jgi:hypothetical protein
MRKTRTKKMPSTNSFNNFSEVAEVLSRFNPGSFHDPVKVKEYSKTFGLEELFQQIDEDGMNTTESDLLRFVSESEEKPFEPDLTDLSRIHWLALKRKAVSVLEFGSGFSTVVLADAARLLSGFFEDWANDNLRCQKPFHIHTVEEDLRFLEITRKRLPKNLSVHATLYQSSVEIDCVEHRIATFYSKLPNVNPDFIYLDGPSQFATNEEVRGFSLASPERMPMSADILSFEFFLQPGTLIVIDGRTANARFLRATLKRNWSYFHDTIGDIHLFELQESPLGPLNKKQMDFCLPDGWLLPQSERGP